MLNKAFRPIISQKTPPKKEKIIGESSSDEEPIVEKPKVQENKKVVAQNFKSSNTYNL